MNRTLLYGIATFLALVAIAMIGGDRQAVAGHGCHGGHGGGGCDGAVACDGAAACDGAVGCHGGHGCFGRNGCFGKHGCFGKRHRHHRRGGRCAGGCAGEEVASCCAPVMMDGCAGGVTHEHAEPAAGETPAPEAPPAPAPAEEAGPQA